MSTYEGCILYNAAPGTTLGTGSCGIVDSALDSSREGGLARRGTLAVAGWYLSLRGASLRLRNPSQASEGASVT